MTLQEAVSEVMNPPSGMNITLDNRLNEPDFVIYLINQKRSMLIERAYRDNGDNMPFVQQPFIIPVVDKVDTNEDNFLDFDKDFGKFYLPSLVQFTHRNKNSHNKALLSITDVKTQTRYFPTTYEEWLVIKRSKNEMSRNCFYFEVGNFIYLSKYAKNVALRGIFQNPLQAHIIDNTIKPSGSLIIGDVYKVKNGSIIHNSVTYNAPQSFTAVVETYTGTGKVYSNSNYRLLTETDPYPMKDSHMDTIKKLIWNEFNLALSAPTDQQGNAEEETDTQRRSSNASLPSSE